MANAEIPVMGGPGQLPGQSGGHGWSNAREIRGLSDLLDRTGDLSLVSKVGAKNAHTLVQEFEKRNPTISYTYKVEERNGRKRWISADGKTLDTLFHSSAVGGDRLQRFLDAEDRMVSDKSISQVAIASEDLGVGLDRHYMYWIRKDAKDPTIVNATAVEFQGSNQEFMSFMNRLDISNQSGKERTSSFEKPLFFSEAQKLDITDVYRAVTQSYATADSRREMEGYIQRLAKDAFNFDAVHKLRDAEVDVLSARVEDKLKDLLKDNDVRTGLGMIAQALPEMVRQIDTPLRREGNRASIFHVVDTRKRREKNYKFLIGKNEGFRSSRFKSMLRQTGGIKLIPYWRHRLNVSEVGGEILTKVKNKVNRRQERLHYHDSISTTSIFVSGDKKKRGDNVVKPSLRLKNTLHEKRHTRKRLSHPDIAISSRDRVHIPFQRRHVVEIGQTFRKRKGTVLFERGVPVSSRKVPLEFSRIRRGLRKRLFERTVGVRHERTNATKKREKNLVLTVERTIRRFKKIKKESFITFVQREQKRFKDFILKPREFVRGMIGHFKKEILQKRQKMRRELRSYIRHLRFTELLRRGFGKEKINRSRFFRTLILGFYGKDSKQYADLRRGKISRRTLLRIERFIRGRISQFERVRLYERSVFGRILSIFRLVEKRYVRPSKKILLERTRLKNGGKRILVKDFWLMFQLKKELEALFSLIDRLLMNRSLPGFGKKKSMREYKSREEQVGRLYMGKRMQFPRKGIVFSYKHQKALFVSP